MVMIGASQSKLNFVECVVVHLVSAKFKAIWKETESMIDLGVWKKIGQSKRPPEQRLVESK